MLVVVLPMTGCVTDLQKGLKTLSGVDEKEETSQNIAAPSPSKKPIIGSVRVALLLPLSGPNEKLGKSMLNAAQMARSDFADNNFILQVHDTHGTPEGVANAARSAIGDDASMILGPLLATNVLAISSMARNANIPVIGFSSDRTVAGNGIYTMGFFPADEVVRIIGYARSQGLRRFAALAPSSIYGRTVVEALRQSATRYGGEVTRVQFYDPQTEDFSGVVRELANYDIRRQALLNHRAELAGKVDKNALKSLKRLKNKQTLGEPPFDALLLADGGARLSAIAALLPFYDIDPKKVHMLGTGLWDSPGLGAEPALRGGWYVSSPSEERLNFDLQYQKLYGVMPHRLSTLAYDATAMAAVLARSKGGSDFSATTLTNPNGFYGRDGIFRFLPDGSVERGMVVLQVGLNSKKVMTQTPTAFNASPETRLVSKNSSLPKAQTGLARLANRNTQTVAPPPTNKVVPTAPSTVAVITSPPPKPTITSAQVKDTTPPY